MKTNDLLFGLLAATMLLTACGKVEVQDNLLLNLDGTTWYEEKYEEDKGSGFQLAESIFWWIRFSDGKVEDWNDRKPKYTLNAEKREITIWGKTYAFRQITPNKMEWTREEGGVRYRRTYARVQPIDPKLLIGKWLLTEKGEWDKKSQQWNTASLEPELRFNFLDAAKGKFYPDREKVIDFTYNVVGNEIGDKFTYGRSLIIELTVNKMIIAWQQDKNKQYRYTFTKQK